MFALNSKQSAPQIKRGFATVSAGVKMSKERVWRIPRRLNAYDGGATRILVAFHTILFKVGQNQSTIGEKMLNFSESSENFCKVMTKGKALNNHQAASFGTDCLCL